MKTIFALLFAFVSYNCLAQTKLIAHKSHSGKTSTFRNAIEGNLFGINNSNFGLAEKAVIKLDTVIYLGGNKVMLVSHNFYYQSAQPDTGRMKNAKNWMATRNTIENDPIFSNVHSLSSIKKQLLQRKEYININQTVFIGFDDKKPKHK